MHLLLFFLLGLRWWLEEEDMETERWWGDWALVDLLSLMVSMQSSMGSCLWYKFELQ
jgi:hypothetical protein